MLQHATLHGCTRLPVNEKEKGKGSMAHGENQRERERERRKRNLFPPPTRPLTLSAQLQLKKTPPKRRPSRQNLAPRGAAASRGHGHVRVRRRKVGQTPTHSSRTVPMMAATADAWATRRAHGDDGLGAGTAPRICSAGRERHPPACPARLDGGRSRQCGAVAGPARQAGRPGRGAADAEGGMGRVMGRLRRRPRTEPEVLEKLKERRHCCRAGQA